MDSVLRPRLASLPSSRNSVMLSAVETRTGFPSALASSALRRVHAVCGRQVLVRFDAVCGEQLLFVVVKARQCVLRAGSEQMVSFIESSASAAMDNVVEIQF